MTDRWAKHWRFFEGAKFRATKPLVFLEDDKFPPKMTSFLRLLRVRRELCRIFRSLLGVPIRGAKLASSAPCAGSNSRRMQDRGDSGGAKWRVFTREVGGDWREI